MGLLSFVKSAGERIFGKSDETKKKEAAMEAAARKQAEEVRRLKMARQLENHVAARAWRSCGACTLRCSASA